jgi:hypothetical protein
MSTDMTPEQGSILFNKTWARMKALQERYNGLEIPERLEGRAMQVLEAKSHQEATGLAERVVQATLIHYLAEWTSGAIPGPYDTDRCARLAAQALSKARYLEDRGLDEQAEEYRERAQQLRDLGEGCIDPDVVVSLKRQRRSVRSTAGDELSQKVLNYITEQGPVSRADVFAHFGEELAPEVWNKIIRALRKTRQVQQAGSKRGARYSAFRKVTK